MIVYKHCNSNAEELTTRDGRANSADERLKIDEWRPKNFNIHLHFIIYHLLVNLHNTQVFMYIAYSAISARRALALIPYEEDHLAAESRGESSPPPLSLSLSHCGLGANESVNYFPVP